MIANEDASSIKVALLWLLFAGTHMVLAMERPRAALVNRLGEWGFIGLFSTVSTVTFAALIHYFAAHRFDGPVGPALGAMPIVGWALYGISAFGAGLMALSLFAYPVSAYALMARQVEYEPLPIERITRHGFFSGLGLLAVAHALLATRLVGTVFFVCLATFTWLGAMHQDAKLLAQRGDVHRRFMAATSMLPFAAILSGRQHLDLRGIPIPAFVAAVLVPWLLRAVHDSIFSAGGLYVIGAVLAGAAIATWQAWRVQRQRAARSTASSGAPD